MLSALCACNLTHGESEYLEGMHPCPVVPGSSAVPIHPDCPARDELVLPAGHVGLLLDTQLGQTGYGSTGRDFTPELVSQGLSPTVKFRTPDPTNMDGCHGVVGWNAAHSGEDDLGPADEQR